MCLAACGRSGLRLKNLNVDGASSVPAMMRSFSSFSGERLDDADGGRCLIVSPPMFMLFSLYGVVSAKTSVFAQCLKQFP